MSLKSVTQPKRKAITMGRCCAPARYKLRSVKKAQASVPGRFPPQ